MYKKKMGNYCTFRKMYLFLIHTWIIHCELAFLKSIFYIYIYIHIYIYINFILNIFICLLNISIQAYKV